MRIAVLFGAVPDGAPPDELDVLAEVTAAEGALRALGHETRRVPLSLDLSSAERELRRCSPDVVVNLVESVEGRGTLAHLGPALLDRLRLPYTGGATEALFVTGNKVLTKRLLRAGGFPTPPWATAEDFRAGSRLDGRAVVKPVGEDASIGLDERSVVSCSQGLAEEVRSRSLELGTECFAEQYVEGREFNVSVLETARGPEVLPIAEIHFLGYPPGKPRLVCYRAKWDAESFEFRNTPRSFDLAPSDGPLLHILRGLAVGCWRSFGLAGYARVDFRVDSGGSPWILEINANPCISPDGGFAAAAAAAGIGPPEVFVHLLEGALRRERSRRTADG